MIAETALLRLTVGSGLVIDGGVRIAMDTALLGMVDTISGSMSGF